ncbi:HtaA domain-containing protein [Baekduia sp.]|uniref:HtaA domain-containing protein n=1 Tax=Baekduia sp. TaxID=2600305 RepID=UPI002E08CAE2|nr:HtaA domain-containing protein [Baekduia sp.]
MIGRSVLCCCIVGAIALPAGASAATPAGSGTSVLTLQTEALGVLGVTTSAVAPARAKGSRFTFPVTTASVGTAATLGHAGGLRLRAGTRSVVLSAPRVRLAKDSRLTARIGKATVTVFTVDGAKRKLSSTAGAVTLRGAKIRLTVAGAAALRRALHLRRLSPGVLGTLTVDAKRSATTTGSEPSGAPTPGGTTTAPGGTTTTPGPSAPIDLGGPAPLARPATAVDVTAAAITWHVRESFIRYINTGEGTATSGGATADPPTVLPGSSVPLVYDFHFPFKDGWYDPVSKTARVTYAGTVTFTYNDHGIKFTASDPEIEIAAGTTSRAIFATANMTPVKRGVLVKLDPGAAASTVHSPDGTDQAYAQIPGSIPADAGASVFAGFYVANDPFGWISVDLTTPPV